jgi:hypothetical protein
MKYFAFMTSRAASLAALASIVVAALLVLPSSTLAAGDANEASCPPETEASPGFRAFLPDCRAYEMVTPPFKEGADQPDFRAVSSNGERVIFSSLSAFAGTESDPFNGGSNGGAVYQLVRSGSGWVASSITPPTSLSPNSRLMGISSDGTRSLWEVVGSAKSVQSTQMDLREPDGSFVEVGQLTPPAASEGPPAGTAGGEIQDIGFAGASANLSHVLFSIRSRTYFWPGDTTDAGLSGEGFGPSLYEYVGTGNTRPMLVGVDNDGELISDCGTELGSLGLLNDTYNAVSVNGETVFFTPLGREVARGESCGLDGLKAPEVDELYARLNHVQTVSISEPSFSDCERCRTGVTTEQEPATTEKRAIFQGASEDGSKAFFLTEQELFTEDTGMNLYEYDFDNPEGNKVLRVSSGAPGYESLDPEVQGVARVSEDGSHVYFVAKAALAGMNGEGNAPTSGLDNLYVFERDAAFPAGRTAFVATLSGEDAEDWGDGGGVGVDEDSDRQVQATPDGRFLVFDSHADLLGSNSGLSQVYEYDAASGRLVRVSVGAANYPSGAASAETHESIIAHQAFDGQWRPTAATSNLAVSKDGSRVIFESRAALTEGAEAGEQNVYEYRSTSGPDDAGASNGVFLIAANTGFVEEPSFDATGADVFLETFGQLVPSDVDTAFNIYDVREDGGFPAPVAPESCAGEVCQGATPAPAAFGAPGSVFVSGSGNLSGVSPTSLGPLSEPKTGISRPVKCKKGFTKRHGKCVETKKKKAEVKRSNNGKGIK